MTMTDKLRYVKINQIVPQNLLLQLRNNALRTRYPCMHIVYARLKQLDCYYIGNFVNERQWSPLRAINKGYGVQCQ